MISALCPTRGRPHNMRKVSESAKASSNIELIFAIDNDDFNSINCAKELSASYIVSPRRKHLSENYNELYNKCSGDIILLLGDDVEFKTPNWDSIIYSVFDEYQDKIVLVFGDDGHLHDEIAIHPFVHRNWINKLGYLAPPNLSRHIDRWLWDIAVAAKKTRYVPEVLIYHPHFDRRQDDQTLRELASRYQHDTNYYNSNKAQRQFDIEKIMGLTLK